MRCKNALLFVDGQFRRGGFTVENGVFTEVTPGDTAGEDLHGAAVLPGFIDLHIHGCDGSDFSDGDLAGLAAMGRFLAARGVTAFCPTAMALPYEALEVAITNARCLSDNLPADCAAVAGVHMEGPFLSPKKAGSQNPAYLQTPDVFAARRLYNLSGGLLRLVDAAPELENAAALARELSPFCTVAAAHSNADYDTAAAFFDAGGTHVTHLFNAMSPLHHREPGILAAAAERDKVTAELICDGLHVHPAAVRLAFRLFPGRLCLISDALRCCGLPDGAYDLSGQTVQLQGGVAKLPDGTLAGSAVTLADCVRRAVSFGIPKEEAILAATAVPSKILGLDKRFGSIAVGKQADFLLCDEKLNIQKVCLRGNFL